MIWCLLVVAFFATVASGPAGLDWLERRRARQDAVTGRVVYLPSAACRPDPLSGRCESETCAVCSVS